MPMDIPPAPTAAPGGAAASASLIPSPAPAAPSPALPGSAVAVFSLLLAQFGPTAGVLAQTINPAAPVVVTSASAVETLTAPGLPGAKSSGLSETAAVPTAKTKTDNKDKSNLTDALQLLPVPVAPPPPTLTPSVPGNANKTIPGTAMDTAPLTSSELLSQSPTVQAPSATLPTPSQADVIVPTETPDGTLPLPTAVNAFVPTVAAQASQAVVTPSAPPVGSPLKTVRAAVSPQTTVAIAAGLSSHAPMPNAVSASAKPVGTEAASPVSGINMPSSLQNGGPSADNQPESQAGKNTETVTVTPQESRVPPTPTKPTPAEKTAVADAAPVTGAPSTAASSGNQSSGAFGITPASPAQNSAALPMPAPDRTRMVHQVADGVQTMALPASGSGQRQVILQLHPQDWGRLHVTVTMTPTAQADGKVTTQVIAHIVAENPTVKAALETHQTDLRQTLHDAGLHLDTLTVTVQAPTGGAQAGLGNDRQPGTNSGGSDAQAGGTGAQSGTPFNGNGNNPQSAYAGFAQGDPSRRPPTYSAANLQTTGPETADLSVASTARSGLSSRVDLHA